MPVRTEIDPSNPRRRWTASGFRSAKTSPEHLDPCVLRRRADGACQGAGVSRPPRPLLQPADFAGASVLEIGCGSGELLSRIRAARKVGIDLSATQIAAARARLPEAQFFVQAGELIEAGEGAETFDVIIISDTLNLAADVQRLFERLHAVSNPDTRLLVNFQNTLWRPVLTLARGLGLKARQPQNSWLASSDVLNLLRLSGWSPVARYGRILVPFHALGVGSFVNRWLGPLLQWFCLTVFLVARRDAVGPRRPLTVSVVIRNRPETFRRPWHTRPRWAPGPKSFSSVIQRHLGGDSAGRRGEPPQRIKSSNKRAGQSVRCGPV